MCKLYWRKSGMREGSILEGIMKNGKFYTIETDDAGYGYVKRYKVTWNFSVF